MILNHPDSGGSTFIATKVNEAKECLLSGGSGKWLINALVALKEIYASKFSGELIKEFNCFPQKVNPFLY
jgi:hypothetical protein